MLWRTPLHYLSLLLLPKSLHILPHFSLTLTSFSPLFYDIPIAAAVLSFLKWEEEKKSRGESKQAH
jgi:hypothetical protein